MPGTELEAATDTFQLPAAGPRLKITTDLGSPQQQVRNFFQPVTLVGSSPQAHVRIDSDIVCDLHCALINTGQFILIKDLHTATGLLQNREVTRLAMLNDGDVLRIGPLPLHIAVRVPMGVATPRLAEPSSLLTMPQLVRVQGPGSAETILDPSVAVIGSRLGCEIYLNHEAVEPVHALLLSLGSQLVMFPISAKQDTEHNGVVIPAGEPVTVASGDVIRVGPFDLRLLMSGCIGGDHDTQLQSHENGPGIDRSSQPPEVEALDAGNMAEGMASPVPQNAGSESAQDRIRRLLESVKKLRNGLD